ncbi:MAG: putative bifunctional diguanylate cyclase/phosphodiesterase [Acidimicrobiales bacterium]
MPRLDPAAVDDIEGIADALRDRAGDVVTRVLRRHGTRHGPMGDLLEEEYGKAALAATIAVTSWICGGDADGGRSAGRSAWQLFGRLAVRDDVPLVETTKRCLRWRDAALDVAAEESRRLGSPHVALAHVSDMLRRSCDVTLVRLSEAFELERARLRGELAEREERLSFQVSHDTLTGLATRDAMLARTEEALARARRHPERVAVLLVDLDDFKDVNDLLGHNAGDELLRAVGERLRAAVPVGAALGRLGADGFVVLLEDLPARQVGRDTTPAREAADTVARAVLDALREPFSTALAAHGPVAVTASIGVAVGRSLSAEAMLRDADVAMQHAKASGKDRSVVFAAQAHWAARSRREQDLELRRALEVGDLYLVYQPTFDLTDMAVTGVEALLRWRHPSRGLVMPDEFVPQLEQSGLINAVGRWVLREACSQGAAWHAGGRCVPISVNVSARQLDDDSFVDDVRAVLSDTDLPAELLTLEITETAIVEDAERSARRLGAVRSLGARVAVDDFGTGYSSLAHLQHFPVDELKIDRSFVAGMLRGRAAGVLVHTLVQLGQALGIETLAEGIEDLAQLAHLRDEHCGGGQGFLLAEPLPAAEVEPFFARWSGAPDEARLSLSAAPQRSR